MSDTFTESVVEDAALAWLESIGWHVVHGPEIAPDMLTAERRHHGEVVRRGASAMRRVAFPRMRRRVRRGPARFHLRRKTAGMTD